MRPWHRKPVGKAPAFRHGADSWGNVSQTLGGMVRKLTAAAAASLSLALAACDGSAAGSCSSREDAALKVTILTDDLKAAQSLGKIDAAAAGDIGVQIIDAGVKFAGRKNHSAYCDALDKIRRRAGL